MAQQYPQMDPMGQQQYPQMAQQQHPQMDPPQMDPPQIAPTQMAPPPKQGMSLKIKWLLGLIVVGALVYLLFVYEGGVFSASLGDDDDGKDKAPPDPAPTGTPGAGEQTGGVGGAGDGQTSGAGDAGAGQTGGDGTGDDPNINGGTGGGTAPAPVDPLAGIKHIKLYPQKNYQGTPKILLPGMVATLGKRQPGGFVWNSMKVAPQVKLVFVRRTSRGFAYGLFNVADIRAYMMSIPAIGGNYQVDTGVALDRAYSGWSDDIQIKVATSDAAWMAEMNTTYQGCIGATKKWNRSNVYHKCDIDEEDYDKRAAARNTATWKACAAGVVPKYTDAYCDKSKPDALKMSGTLW